jgi:hypothetical protein
LEEDCGGIEFAADDGNGRGVDRGAWKMHVSIWVSEARLPMPLAGEVLREQSAVAVHPQFAWRE